MCPPPQLEILDPPLFWSLEKNPSKSIIHKQNHNNSFTCFHTLFCSQSTIEDILKTENELEKQFEQLMMEKQAKANLEKR